MNRDFQASLEFSLEHRFGDRAIEETEQFPLRNLQLNWLSGWQQGEVKTRQRETDLIANKQFITHLTPLLPHNSSASYNARTILDMDRKMQTAAFSKSVINISFALKQLSKIQDIKLKQTS